MPEKITSLANVTVNIIYVVSVLFSFLFIISTIVSSYVFYVVKTLNKKIDDIKELLKHDDEKMEKLFTKCNSNSVKIGKVETNLSNLRESHNHNHNYHNGG